MDKHGWFRTSLMICMVIASSTPTIPDDITKALDAVFQEESEMDDHARVLVFLAKALEAGTADPYIHALKTKINKPGLFKNVAQQMAKDINTDDPKYRQFMQDIWSNFLKEDGLVKSDHGQGWDNTLQKDLTVASAEYAFMRAVKDLPPDTFDAIKHVVEKVAIGPFALVDAMTSAKNHIAVVRLDFVFLGWSACQNIHRWWKGEISGTRCVKNILDSGVGVAGGFAGGVGGHMAGAWVGGAVGGPVGLTIGSIAGAVFGAIGGSNAGHILSDKLTQWAFGLPRSEALENAYNFIGVKTTASNSEINSKYRKLSLIYHPDKGGVRDVWLRLQYSMAIIREARDEPN